MTLDAKMNRPIRTSQILYKIKVLPDKNLL